MATESSTATLRCIVVTPEDTALDTTAEFVTVPLYDGEMGLAPLHAPMIGRLGYGELRIESGGETTRLFVDGGFVQVADNVVSVMTGRAKPLDELDTEAAERDLTAALAGHASGEEALAVRRQEIDRARGILRAATKRG